jgi:hypothetical protein
MITSDRNGASATSKRRGLIRQRPITNNIAKTDKLLNALRPRIFYYAFKRFFIAMQI